MMLIEVPVRLATVDLMRWFTTSVLAQRRGRDTEVVMKDVVELIEQDHRDMEQMFARLQAGDGDRAILFQQMAAMLTAHSRAEEAEVYPAIAGAGDEEEVQHAREEHAEADELLAKLKEADPGTPEF